MCNIYFTILLLLFCNYPRILGEEIYCNIIGKYPLQRISENFLSLSLDPEVFLGGLNLSSILAACYAKFSNLGRSDPALILTSAMSSYNDTSLLLAKHLSPAYVRITGPSTRLVKEVDVDDKRKNSLLDDESSAVVTPSMWFDINEWLKLANLTPVFGVNDTKPAGEVWNPESTLLEIFDRLNVSCYWMLGFDSSKRNENQNEKDHSMFRNILDIFQGRSNCRAVSELSMDDTEYVFEDLKDITNAVTWQSNEGKESSPKKKLGLNAFKKPIKFWTLSPKPEPLTFSSTLLWAEQVGNAAKMGYDMIFRHPKCQDTFADTPVYWFSLLHKKLIGKSVLEAKPSTNETGPSVFAYCAKKQKVSNRGGALAVIIINNNLQSYTIKVKLEQIPWTKFMEVHSYILTSPYENSTDTFLNGKHLTPEVLLEETGLLPQTSIVKSKSYVPLNVPPMSICFFVLPKARVPACINEENKNEIFSLGNSSPSEKEVLSFQLRSFFNRDSGLEGLKRKTRKQLEPEEKLFKNDLKLKFDNLKQNIYSDSRESQIHPSRRRYHLEKSKRQDMDMEKLIKRRDELKKSVLGPRKQEIKSRGKYLDLMSEETGRILKDRARARAARRNVFLTEDELDLIVEAVRRKLIKPDYKQPNSLTEIGMRKRMQSTEESEASSGEPTNQFRRSRRRPRDVNSKLLNLRSKIEERRQRLEEKMSEVVGNAQNLRHDIKERLQKLKQMNHRFRRDINMELLNLKMEEQKKKAKKQMKMQSKGFFKDREVRKSSLRKSEKTSDELSESDDVESVEKVIPAMEFFTKSVTSEESKEETIDSLNNNKGPKKLSLFNKKGTNKFAGIKPTSSDLYEKSESEEANNSNDLLTFSDEFNDFGGELPCMYQYFGSQRKDASNTDKVGEILRKWNKQNKRKGKMGGSSKSTTSDSTEYSRKRRGIACDEHYVRKRRSIPKAAVNDGKSQDELALGQKKHFKENIDGTVDLYKTKTEKFSEDKSGLIHNTDGLKKTETGTKMDVKDKNRNKKKRKRKGVKPRRKVLIKHRLKDLTEVEGKSKLKKSLARNKLILQILENKKNSHHGQTPKIGDDELFIYKGLNKKERKAIHENLELLKERLLYKLSANDVNFQKKLGMYKKQAVKDFNKIKSGKYHDAKTEEYKENKDENRNNQDSSPVEKVKRSVFGEKPEVFGNYKPLTPGIKEWKPSDILTLGKDMNLDSASNLKPDFEAFRNVITPNRYSNLRRKRKSIDNDISYTDTVSYMNDIGRDSVPYVVPNVKTESSDYKRRISTQYMNKVEPEPLESKGATVTIHNNKEVDDLIATASNFSTVINRLSDNIQKIPTKEEQSIIDNFINKISVFFMNIGKALGFY